MTMTARYANWKAPAEDGQIVIWPAPAVLAEETRNNFELLKNAHSVWVQNVPLPELRRAQRHWVGHTNDDELLIASGHQTELYHPGVWVKDLLSDAQESRRPHISHGGGYGSSEAFGFALAGDDAAVDG
jgi:hypothetical protein